MEILLDIGMARQRSSLSSTIVSKDLVSLRSRVI